MPRLASWRGCSATTLRSMPMARAPMFGPQHRSSINRRRSRASNPRWIMKFFVEFQLKPGNKEKVLELFELQGPNRKPGVTFKGAWIGKNEEVIYVLAES